MLSGLIILDVHPLWAHTLAAAVLPWLEAFLENLLWYGVEAGHNTEFDVFKCHKTWTPKPRF
jgi:hypothetical protein